MSVSKKAYYTTNDIQSWINENCQDVTTYVLLAWGSNSHGQLGILGGPEEQLEPKRVEFPFKYPITKIVCGGGHSFIFDINNRIFVAGLNTSGQCGLVGFDKTDVFLPLSTNECMGSIRKLSAGWDANIAIDFDGNVLCWGSNKYGQLGFGKDVIKVSEPKELENSEKVFKAICVSMGLRHSAVVRSLSRESHRLYTSGWGKYGQLGIVENGSPVLCLYGFKPVTLPVPPECSYKILSVACGQRHTLVLTNLYKIYGFGDNRNNQVSVNSEETQINTPIEIDMRCNGEQVKSIYCGWQHSAAVFHNYVILWGCNKYGQLGTKDKNAKYNEVESEFSSFASGSEHCIALQSTTVHSWGWNEHGSCGNGKVDNVTEPHSINIKNSVMVGTGYGHSFSLVVE